MRLKALGSFLGQVQVSWHKALTWTSLNSVSRGWLEFFNPEDGDIHILAVFIYGILGYDRGSLTEVLRHKFGYTLENCYSEYFIDERFVDAFGDQYVATMIEWDQKDCISKYAMTNIQKDFAYGGKSNG